MYKRSAARLRRAAFPLRSYPPLLSFSSPRQCPRAHAVLRHLRGTCGGRACTRLLLGCSRGLCSGTSATRLRSLRSTSTASPRRTAMAAAAANAETASSLSRARPLHSDKKRGRVARVNKGGKKQTAPQSIKDNDSTARPPHIRMVYYATPVNKKLEEHPSSQISSTRQASSTTRNPHTLAATSFISLTYARPSMPGPIQPARPGHVYMYTIHPTPHIGSKPGGAAGGNAFTE